jgi:LCP family protein required for cell wall assembly
MTDPRPRNRALAALFSFVFPGLGQAYAGQRQLATILAAPVLLLILAALLMATVFADVVRNGLLSAPFLAGALVLDAVLLVWRLFAIGQAGLAPLRASTEADPHRWRRAGSIGVVVLLMAATIGMHGWAGIVLNRLDTALEDVFSGGQSGGSSSGDQHDSRPINQPEYHWDGTERVTFLLLGIDAGPGRDESLTDTILAVSIDPVARTAVMVSVPRDTGYVPLPDRTIYADGLYPHKINELATEASLNPGAWCPDLPASQAAECGLRSLERSIALYIGVPIQFYAQVDLEGFARLIDAVGGVTLCLPGKMVDPEYGGPTWEGHGVELPPGCSQYDGAHALAYARIRKGWIELPDGTRDYQNDFKRADRQQKVLLQLRQELANADLIFELPGILNAVGQTVLTDFPRSKAGDLASLLPLITAPGIERRVLDYPDFVDPPVDPNVNYLLIPRRDDVRDGMLALLGPDVELSGWYLGTEDDGPPS